MELPFKTITRRNKFAAVCASLITLVAPAQQSGTYDEKALLILDRMSQVIGNLRSCSFQLRTSTDRNYRGVTQTELNSHEVHMSSPNRLMVDAHGDKGHRAYYYNGKTLNYYSFGENNFSTVNAPSTVLDLFDSISAAYGIEFPAADFFYPDFTDDLMASSGRIDFEGRTEVEGKECFHIVASGRVMNVQIWISNDAVMLPRKVVINYYEEKLLRRYEGDFTGWQLNPDLPEPMFEFTAPPGAKQVYLMPSQERPIK